MEYSRSLKDFLPSKKIQIILGIFIIAIAAYFLIPRIIAQIQNKKNPSVPLTNLALTNLKGDPTTRDSDGDGVADWREIAVGLDPYIKETNKGVPDGEAFETFKSSLGEEFFAEAEMNATDTDKISLTLSNDITQNIKSGGASSTSISEVTANEVLNYINSQKQNFTQFSVNDLEVVESTLATNQAYALAMQNLLRDDATTKNFASDIKSYLDGTGSEVVVKKHLASIAKTITAFKTTPVPNAATTLHLPILNSAQGIYQTIQLIDPNNKDETQRLGVSALLQDYAIQMSTAVGKLTLYFSVAQSNTSYIQ